MGCRRSTRTSQASVGAGGTRFLEFIVVHCAGVVRDGEEKVEGRSNRKKAIAGVRGSGRPAVLTVY
jgi:hypothetical protein